VKRTAIGIGAFHAPYEYGDITVMADKSPADKIPLTVNLPADLARRLKSAAEAHKRAAADLVIELLDRHLPRPSSAAGPKGKIPYA
jgi:hypothetical protein